MKKITLLSVFILCTLLSISQVLQFPSFQPDPSNFNKFSKGSTLGLNGSNPMEKRALGDHHSYWVNFPYLLSLYKMEAYNTMVSVMAPDSTLKVRMLKINPVPAPHYDFTYYYNQYCSVGLTLNPYSKYFILPALTNSSKYTVDSVGINYNYERYLNDTIADTLVVQLYRPTTLHSYTWVSNGLPACAVPDYNRAKAEGKNADLTLRILLTKKDTFSLTNNKSAIKYVQTGFTVYNGGPSAVVWTFKPGKKYEKNDTIPWAKWDSVKGITHPVNGFWWYFYTDTSKTELDEYTNGNFINAQQRYFDPLPSFPSLYLPGCLYTEPAYALVNFKISYVEALPRDTMSLMTTDTASQISDITAISGGYIYDNGGHAITARGVCWDVNPNPTIALTTKTSDGTGSGHFVSSLTPLTSHTTYYVRAYATNSKGTSYGNEIKFKTLDTAIVAFLTTAQVTIDNISKAHSGGTIISDGGRPITKRGICYDMYPNPTIALLNTTLDGSGLGTFSSVMDMLNPYSKYYVRAYATNAIGTAYGNELSFYTWHTGVISTDPSDEVHVYSNGKKIYLTKNVGIMETCLVKVYNQLGKEVSGINLINSSDQIDLSNCASGLYFVKVSLNNKSLVYRVSIQ